MAGSGEREPRRKVDPALLIPDPRLLEEGRKGEFAVKDVSKLGLTSTKYGGILTGLKRFFGWKLDPYAPTLIILDPKNRRRFATLASEDRHFPVPPESGQEIVIDHDEDMLLAPPVSATRENVASAGAKVYLYAANPELIELPDQLWRHSEELEFEDREIQSALVAEAIATGFATLAAITINNTAGAADEIINGIISGKPGERVDFSERQRYLFGHLQNLRTARDDLIRAQTASTQESKGLYRRAQELKDEAIVPLGVYFVHSIMRLPQKGQRGDWLPNVISNPPELLGDLLDPVGYSKKLLAGDVESAGSLKVAASLDSHSGRGGTHDDDSLWRSREEPARVGRRIGFEPRYPFVGTRYTIFESTEPQTVTDPEQQGTRQLHEVPFYYLGNQIIPLITPAVIRNFAEITGEEPDTAERVIAAFFGPFEQMDAYPALRRPGNQPQNFSRWKEAGLRFRRYAPQQESWRTDFAGNNFSLFEVADGLYALPGADPSHLSLLAKWYTNGKYSEELIRKQMARTGEPDPRNIPKGIVLDSILQSLPTDAVSGPDGILPAAQDREFLQRMGDFISRGELSDPNLQALKQPVIYSREVVAASGPDTAAAVAESADVTPEPPKPITAADLSEFERNFDFYVLTEKDAVTIPGFGRVYVINSPKEGPDPVITRSLLSEYSSNNRGADSNHTIYQQVEKVLFRPFEQAQQNASEYANPDDYLGAFKEWFHITQKYGFVLFPDIDYRGRPSVNYGFRASGLRAGLSITEYQLRMLKGFGPKSQRYLDGALTALEKPIDEGIRRGLYIFLTGEKPPQSS